MRPSASMTCTIVPSWVLIGVVRVPASACTRTVFACCLTDSSTVDSSVRSSTESSTDADIASATASTATATTVSRNFRLCRRHREDGRAPEGSATVAGQAVARAAHGLQGVPAERGGYLAAQVAHVHLHHVRVGVVGVPDVLQQLRLGDHLVAPAQIGRA